MNKELRVRMTKMQYERVRNNANSKGYKTISRYVRDAVLNKDMAFEKKFNEMFKIVSSLEKGEEKKSE